MRPAILVGVRVPAVDDVAHAASLVELGPLVKTLGYEDVATIPKTALPSIATPCWAKGALGSSPQ